MLTDAVMAQITKRHQGHSMTRGRFDEGHGDAVWNHASMLTSRWAWVLHVCAGLQNIAYVVGPVLVSLNVLMRINMLFRSCMHYAAYTHFLRYPIPGISIDSALPYPTLPRGPPLATLAPKSIQLSNICKVLVNQKPATLSSQLEILEITLDFEKVTQLLESYVYFWCPDQIPRANSKITSNFQIWHQNPKSGFKIPNLAPKSKNNKNNKYYLCLNVLFKCCCLFSFWRTSLLKCSFWDYVGETQMLFCCSKSVAFVAELFVLS